MQINIKNIALVVAIPILSGAALVGVNVYNGAITLPLAIALLFVNALAAFFIFKSAADESDKRLRCFYKNLIDNASKNLFNRNISNERLDNFKTFSFDKLFELSEICCRKNSEIRELLRLTAEKYASDPEHSSSIEIYSSKHLSGDEHDKYYTLKNEDDKDFIIHMRSQKDKEIKSFLIFIQIACDSLKGLKYEEMFDVFNSHISNHIEIYSGEADIFVELIAVIDKSGAHFSEHFQDMIIYRGHNGKTESISSSTWIQPTDSSPAFQNKLKLFRSDSVLLYKRSLIEKLVEGTKDSFGELELRNIIERNGSKNAEDLFHSVYGKLSPGSGRHKENFLVIKLQPKG